MRVLITGVAGFYGSHFAKYVLDNTDWDIVGLDRIDEAGNLGRIYVNELYKSDRFKFVWHDLKAPINEHIAHQIGDIDRIFHIAAASHVDRSIKDPLGFVLDNVVGTTQLLEYARTLENLDLFLYFSTDEVFGSLNKDKLDNKTFFAEGDRLNPGNPYSASKAAAEMICIAYENTYNIPLVITNCMNIMGSMQHPEKFIPKILRYIESGETLPIHSNVDGTVSGSRHYIHADAVSKAIMFIVEFGEIGQKYNIGGQKEMSNLEMAEFIDSITDEKLNYEMVPFDTARPGNDFAYGIDNSKMKDMGFVMPNDFEDKLKATIDWYLANPEWYRL